MSSETHNIPPVYDGNSKILILGSFPSVKSREQEFFYAHPQNRFWRLLARLTDEEVPASTDGKKDFLLRHSIALWDVIANCDIKGSGDSSIKNVQANDLSPILKTADIRAVFLNGQTAARFFKAHMKHIGIPFFVLPSTSPANAAASLDVLTDKWRIILGYL